MKLNKLFESDVLAEGIKFTRKEINSVKKKSRDILVGFEFEFNAMPTAMQAVIDGESPKDVDPEEPQPREEWTMDDVWESEEYMEERNRLETEAVNEEMERIKNEKESEYEEAFGDGHEDYIDILDTLSTTYRQGTNAKDFSIVNYMATDKINKKYEKLFEFPDMVDNPDVVGYHREQTISAMLDLKKLQTWMDESGYGDLLMGIDLTDAENYDDERREFYPPDAQSFINLMAQPQMKDLQSWIENLMEINFDDPALVDVTKPREAAGEGQQEMEFSEVSSVDEKLVRIIEDILWVTNSHKELLQLEILFSQMEYYFKAGGSTANPYYDALEKYQEALWEEEREEIEESVQENIWNYSYVDEQIDMMEIIAEIQRNQAVVVLDDEDEPYVEPDGEGWSGGGTVSSRAASVKRFVQEYGHIWDINFDKDFESIVDDEGYGMVEFKNKPKPLNEALELMHNFLRMIRQIGTTNTGKAGLHTNMSLKSSKFTNRNFNAVKLVSLVDNQLMHELFPVRGHVDDLLSAKLTPKMVYTLAGAPSTQLLDQFSLVLGDQKFQGINFDHMKSRFQEAKRIEFRYTGGKDYAERGKTIEWAVYRFAYVLEAAFNENFLENQYKKNVIDLLDDATAKFFGRQKVKEFTKLRKIREKNPEIMDYETFIEKHVAGGLKVR